ncbi:MAG: TIR domain-containing protein [Steroidobacteraceae bacterium]
MAEAGETTAGAGTRTVFISYASQDAAVAQQVVSAMEHAGLTCWIAPRDVEPGALYADEIVRAINECRVVVLVLSGHAAASAHVGRELERAASKNRRIIALRIDATPLPRAFEYFLSESQWIDVGPGGIEPAAVKLAESVGRHLGAAPTAAPFLVHATAPTSAKKSRSLILGIAAALVVAIGAAATWKLWFADHSDAAQATAGTAIGHSIAVLPFADMSAEKDQEYFSDGLAEELLNELAQIKELRVAGRTSSFSFKGKNEDLRSIGTKLGVSNILEGSVRKAGNRLRITAQLINAADGTHLWSNTYDRELADVFAVQEEIAMAVTGALSITLDVGAMSRANGGTTKVAAYDKYLQAQALWYRGGLLEVFQKASQLYRDAVTIDPGFARAWYGLHKSAEQETLVGGDVAARRQEMVAAKERLVALAPQAWFTQTIRTADFVFQRKWFEADAMARAALVSSPGPETARSYGVFLQRVGRAREAEQYIRRAVEAEPLSATMSLALQTVLDMAGRPDEAQAEYLRGSTLGANSLVAHIMAMIRAWSHKPPDKPAVESALRAVKAATNNNLGALLGITLANWDDRPAALAALRREYARLSDPGIMFAAAGDHYGDKEMVLATIRRGLVEMNAPQLYTLWQFNESGWRQDPRYKDILRDLGLVDYYRKIGKWPDICKPLGTNDFECH